MTDLKFFVERSVEWHKEGIFLEMRLRRQSELGSFLSRRERRKLRNAWSETKRENL